VKTSGGNSLLCKKQFEKKIALIQLSPVVIFWGGTSERRRDLGSSYGEGGNPSKPGKSKSKRSGLMVL